MIRDLALMTSYSILVGVATFSLAILYQLPAITLLIIPVSLLIPVAAIILRTRRGPKEETNND